MDAAEILNNRVTQALVIIIVSAVLASVFDLPTIFLDLAVSLAIGRIFGGIAATVVIGFGGEVLEDIEIVVKGVSISGFTVAAFLVGRLLF